MNSFISNLTSAIKPQVQNDPSWLSQWLITFPPSDSQKIRECVTLLTQTGLSLSDSILKVFSLTLSKMGKTPEQLVANLSKVGFFPLLEFYLPPRPLILGYSLDGPFNSMPLFENCLLTLKTDLCHLKEILILALHHAEVFFISLSEKEKENWINKFSSISPPSGTTLVEKFMGQLISIIFQSLNSIPNLDYLSLVNVLTTNPIDYFFTTSIKRRVIDWDEDLKSILERNLHPLIVNSSAVSAFDNYLKAFRKNLLDKEKVLKWDLGTEDEEKLYEKFFHLLLNTLDEIKTEDEIGAVDVSKAMKTNPHLAKIYEDLF